MAAPTWVDSESVADAAIAEIRRHAVAGYDSEFDGVDIGSQSCVGRSRLDVFSIAVPSGPFQPIGFNETTSWVFEGSLVTAPCVREYLEDPGYRKIIHNRPVDEHTARNAGVRIRGGLCSLNMARWVYPERSNLLRGNYDLNSLCQWRIGRGKTEDFDDLFGYDDYEPYESTADANWCEACGGFGCRKKKPPHDAKVLKPRTVVRQRKVRRILPLSEVRPGHALFDRYLVYAAVDAELAMMLYQMMLIDGRRERPYPWGL